MLTPRDELRGISKKLFDEALSEGTSAEEAQEKLRLREVIEGHLLAVDALVEIGATREAVARILSKLSDQLEDRQPA